MNRFGPTQAAIDSNEDRRLNALFNRQLPSIDDSLEALSFGETQYDVEALEHAGATCIANNPYMN